MKINFRKDGVVQLRGVKNHEMWYRNFQGLKSLYNAEGNRNFVLRIYEPDVAQALIDEGFNVKMKVPRETDNNANPRDPWYEMKVNIRFWGGRYDPKIYWAEVGDEHYVTKGEESMRDIDEGTFEEIDMDIYPKKYISSQDGKEHVSARLNNLRVVAEVNAFADELGINID